MFLFRSFLLALLVSVFVPTVSDAAILKVVPSAGGEGAIAVDVVIDSEETAINAAQATVSFPTDMLSVEEISTNGSVFRFWVEEPSFSNDAGAVTFIGGTPRGQTGESLYVATIYFTAQGTGLADVVLKEAVITASDGKGTDVLSGIENLQIDLGDVPVVTATEVFVPESIVVPEPEAINRVAVAANELPQAPVVRVPLYPDSAAWYSHSDAVTALWDVPNDVTKVAVAADQNPNTEPARAEEQLVNGKKLGFFDEGVWYVHVQFKNNIGWGPVTHYRVAIDMTPPREFTLETDSVVSDNPSPILRFETQDALSGVSHALIFIDDKEPLRATSSPSTLPPQAPGNHVVVVRVYDFAQNSVEDVIAIETLPLPQPSVSFVTESVPQDAFIFATGSSVPNGFADIVLRDNAGREVFAGSAATDPVGRWELTIEDLFPTGKYTLTVTARDARGATSYPSEPVTLKVRSKVIFTLGFVELGWFEIFALAVLLVVAAGAVGAWYYVLEQQKRYAYSLVMRTDIKKYATLLEGTVHDLRNDIQNKKNKFDKQAKGEIDFALDKLDDISGKMKKYLTKHAEKL